MARANKHLGAWPTPELAEAPLPAQRHPHSLVSASAASLALAALICVALLLPASGGAATTAIPGTPAGSSCVWYDDAAGKQGSKVTGIQCRLTSSFAGQKTFDTVTGQVVAEDPNDPIPLVTSAGLIKTLNDWLAANEPGNSIQAGSFVGIEAIGGKGRNGDSCGACDSGGGAGGGYAISVQTLGGMQQLLAQHGGTLSPQGAPLLFVFVGREGLGAQNQRGGGGGAASWVLGKTPSSILPQNVMFPSVQTNVDLNESVNGDALVDDLVFAIGGGGGGGGGARLTGGGKHGGSGGRMNGGGPVTSGDASVPGEGGNGNKSGRGGSSSGPGVGGAAGNGSDGNSGQSGIGGAGGRDAEHAGWVDSVLVWGPGMGGSTGGNEAEGGGGGGGWGAGGGGSQTGNEDVGTQGHGGGGGGSWARQSYADVTSLPTLFNLQGDGFSLSDAGFSQVVISFGVGTDTTPATLSSVQVTPERWSAGSSLPSAARARVGATIRFRSSEAARASLTFERVLRGRRAGRRHVPAGAFRVRARKGLNRVRFEGRLSKRRRLGPGSYRVTVGAIDSAGIRSKPRTARFAIVRRSRGPRG